MSRSDLYSTTKSWKLKAIDLVDVFQQFTCPAIKSNSRARGFNSSGSTRCFYSIAPSRHATKQFQITLVDIRQQKGNECFLVVFCLCDHQTLSSCSLSKLSFLSLQIQDAAKAKTSDVVVFAGPPVTEQVLWPRHCVQESWGAEFHKDLKVITNSDCGGRDVHPHPFSHCPCPATKAP